MPELEEPVRRFYADVNKKTRKVRGMLYLTDEEALDMLERGYLLKPLRPIPTPEETT